MDNNLVSRRTVMKSSVLGLLAVSIPSISFTNKIIDIKPASTIKDNQSLRYPAIEDDIDYLKGLGNADGETFI
jgi:hypothetical protein